MLGLIFDVNKKLDIGSGCCWFNYDKVQFTPVNIVHSCNRAVPELFLDLFNKFIKFILLKNSRHRERERVRGGWKRTSRTD